MSDLQCPRCQYDRQTYNDPSGKVVRNPYATASCPDCNGSGHIAALASTSEDIGSYVSDECPTCAATGKVSKAVYDDCKACDGSGFVPDVVVNAIRNAFPNNADDILKELRWSMDHFSFTRWGMYVGVECDGYIHS